jgi:ribonucleotide monophosphatase NagD (HAD superfamily)
VVLDIDGVVTRGATAVPGAAEALRRLRQQRIPFVFMTNGGVWKEGNRDGELLWGMDKE